MTKKTIKLKSKVFTYLNKDNHPLSLKARLFYYRYLFYYNREYFPKNNPNLNKLHLQQAQEHASNPYLPSKLVAQTFNIKPSDYVDKCFYAKADNHSDKVIFYIHGGSFFNHPSVKEFAFIRTLADATNSRVYLPIYPIGPLNHHQMMNDFIFKAYIQLQTYYSYDNIIIIGNECGANLALNLAYQLKQEGYPPCKEIVLQSPLTNLVLDKRMEEYEDIDPFLSMNTLNKQIQFYAYDYKLSDVRINPFYQTLDLGCKISILNVGKSILYIDGLALKEKSIKENIYIDYIEYPYLYQNFYYDNILEQEDYFKDIRNIIDRERVSLYQLKADKPTKLRKTIKASLETKGE